MIKKPVAKKKRKNVAPASPRFMPSSQMAGERGKKTSTAPKPPKKKKPKTVNYGACKKGMAKIGFGKGRKTAASCRG